MSEICQKCPFPCVPDNVVTCETYPFIGIYIYIDLWFIDAETCRNMIRLATSDGRVL